MNALGYIVLGGVTLIALGYIREQWQVFQAWRRRRSFERASARNSQPE